MQELVSKLNRRQWFASAIAASAMAARSRYGIQFPAGAEPEPPIAAEDMIAMKREDRFEITREELMTLVDDVLRARGVFTD